MLNDKITVYCFKDKKWINAIDCSFKKSGQFKPCYLYNRICKNLYGHNRYDSNRSLEPESIKEIIELIKAGEAVFMLSTNEMIEFLGNTYNLNVSRELIFQYAKKGLLNPEKKRIGRKGKGLGVKTYWPDSAPGRVYIIKELLRQKFKLDEISKYYLMFTQGYFDLTDEPELSRYYRVIKYLLAVEAGIDFREHNILKLHFQGAWSEPEVNSKPIGKPSGRVSFIEGNKIFKSITFRNGVYKVKEEDKILYSSKK